MTGRVWKGLGIAALAAAFYAYILLRIDTPLADALRHGDSAGFVRTARSQKGFKPLSMAAFEYACQGITSMEEVMRLSGQIDESAGITDMTAIVGTVEEKVHAAV